MYNLVSIPFIGCFDKNNIIVIDNRAVYSWSEAVNEGVILNFVYHWNRQMQSYESTDILEYSYGYWMYSYQPCMLLRQ